MKHAKLWGTHLTDRFGMWDQGETKYSFQLFLLSTSLSFVFIAFFSLSFICYCTVLCGFAIHRYRRPNHMTCRLDRLWPPTWLGFHVRSAAFRPVQAVSIEVRGYGAICFKTDRVFLKMDAKMESQMQFKFDPNPFKRGLSTRLEWNKLGEVTNTIDD